VNTFSATYKISGSTMTIGPVTATKMAGPPDLMTQENAYFEALAKTASYKIESYQLTLLDTSGGVLAVFMPFATK
jgi:putative lipoprotein